jgi:hypothetical protein
VGGAAFYSIFVTSFDLQSLVLLFQYDAHKTGIAATATAAEPFLGMT